MRTPRVDPKLESLFDRIARRFSIVHLTPDRSAELRDFLRRAYADQPAAAFHDTQVAVGHWRWVGDLYPPCRGEGSTGWICLKHGQIVGYFGTLPALAHLRGEHVPFCWGRDLIAAPELRGAGVGPLLIRTVVKESQRPFLIAGLNEAVYVLYQRMGFLDLGMIPLYAKIYQPGRFANGFGWPGAVRRTAAIAIPILQGVRTLGAGMRSDGVACETLARFDERFDRWWAGVEPFFPRTVHRDSATMNWRYFQHPRYQYTVLVVKQGEAWKGVAVVRYGRSRGLAAGFITELLADPRDRGMVAVLVRQAEAFLLRAAPEPLGLIRCAVFHSAIEHALVRAGFLRVPSPLHWMMTSAAGHESLQPFARRHDWMLNGGDSDLDAV